MLTDYRTLTSGFRRCNGLASLHTVVQHLFEDERLFAADRRPMADALADHAELLGGPHRRVIGPFVCPASRLAELDACVAAGMARPPSIAVVGTEGAAGWRRAWATSGLAHVETPLAVTIPSPPGRVALYVEIARHLPLDSALDVVAGAGARVKVRCGGGGWDAGADHLWLALVLVGCAARGLAVKVAAGPTHAYAPGTGNGTRQGIVNLLAAAGAARADAAHDTVARLLAADESDTERLLASVPRARELLAAIGARSVADAAAGLATRGLL